MREIQIIQLHVKVVVHINSNCKTKITSHNKRLALRRLTAARVPQNRVRAYALCTVLLHHILPALVFATQSPYSGWQNVANLEGYATVWISVFLHLIRKFRG